MLWLKRYWPVLFLIGCLLAVTDVTLSALWTCHPISEQARQAIEGQNTQNCGYLHGPFLISLEWLIAFIDEHDGFFVVLFTAGLVAFTAALWRATNKLWDAGERQLKTTRSVAAVQARNNRRQLRIAEDTAERQLRAYLTPISAELRNLKVDGEIQGHIVLKNTGQTPVFELVTIYGIGFVPYQEDLPLPPEMPVSTNASRSIIGAGGESHLTHNLSSVFTAERYEALKAGTHLFQMFGRAVYKDAFGKERTTHFHYIYGGPGAVLNAKGVMRHAHHGNDAD